MYENYKNILNCSLLKNKRIVTNQENGAWTLIENRHYYFFLKKNKYKIKETLSFITMGSYPNVKLPSESQK